MHPVAAAVAPMKDEAIEASRVKALAILDNIKARLEAAGWDLEIAAPWPDTHNSSRAEYASKRARAQLYASLTKPSPDRQFCRRPKDPDIRVWSEEDAVRYVKQAQRDAAAQYDAYVIKLIGKVGDGVLAAEMSYLAGLWYNSVLVVTKEGGLTERWKTSCIINVSKLGTVFNQWPTRKIK